MHTLNIINLIRWSKGSADRLIRRRSKEIIRQAIHLLVDKGDRENTGRIIELDKKKRNELPDIRQQAKWVLFHHIEQTCISCRHQVGLGRLAVFDRRERMRNGENKVQTALGPLLVPGSAVRFALRNQTTFFHDGLGIHDLEEICRCWIASAAKECHDSLEKPGESEKIEDASRCF